MGLISYSNIQDSVDAVNAESLNTPFNTLYDEFNGNIDANNLADNAVTTNKIIDDAVTAAKVDFGGLGVGVWWEEIARTTLSGAGDTISLTGITAKKYLRVIFRIVNSGTIDAKVRFNNDTGANYSARYSVDFGAAASVVSQTAIGLNATTPTQPLFGFFDLVNVLAEEKFFIVQSSWGATGAANYAVPLTLHGKWANTAAQVTRVDIVNVGAGDFASGSQAIVLGHD